MEFIQRGCSMNKALQYLGLSRSSFYYRMKQGKPGRPVSQSTFTRDGGSQSNAVVMAQIRELISGDYVDYGYRKVCEYLRWKFRYVINPKKVERMMREEKLLLPPLKGRSGNKSWVKITTPQPEAALQHFEMDIKYIYVQGLRRNVFLLSVVDLFHREWLDYELGLSMRKHQVKILLDRIMSRYFPDAYSARESKILFSIRTDNGSQFESHLVRQYMNQVGIFQEFTRPATPQQNGHIESFHSVLQRALVDKHEFESLEELENHLLRFHRFYNEERLHSAVCFRPPAEFLRLWNENRVGLKKDKKGRNKFFFKEAEPKGPASLEESLLGVRQV